MRRRRSEAPGPPTLVGELCKPKQVVVCLALAVLVGMVVTSLARSGAQRKQPMLLRRMKSSGSSGSVGGRVVDKGLGQNLPPAPVDPARHSAHVDPKHLKTPQDSDQASKTVGKTVSKGADGKERSLVIVTAANSQYQEWQKRTAVYHIAKHMPEYPLVTLVANDLPETHELATKVDCSLPYMGCPAYVTEGVGRSLVPGDDFIVYNRAWSMLRFFEDHGELFEPGGEYEGISNILLIEPDMVVMKPIRDVAQRGTPIGHHFFYMEEGPIKERILTHCTKHPEFYKPVGLPMAFHIDDLRKVLPLWINKTIEVRTSEWGWDNGDKSWIADMWGLTCALCDLQMEADDRALGLHIPMDVEWEDSAWAVHYTFFTESGDYRFEKRDWTRGAPRPRPFGPIPRDTESGLKIKFADAMDEALVAVYGETTLTSYDDGGVGL